MNSIEKMLVDENLCDEVGLIPPELLKKEFKGFEAGEIIIFKDALIYKEYKSNLFINSLFLNGGRNGEG